MVRTSLGFVADGCIPCPAEAGAQSSDGVQYILIHSKNLPIQLRNPCRHSCANVAVRRQIRRSLDGRVGVRDRLVTRQELDNSRCQTTSCRSLTRDRFIVNTTRATCSQVAGSQDCTVAWVACPGGERGAKAERAAFSLSRSVSVYFYLSLTLAMSLPCHYQWRSCSLCRALSVARCACTRALWRPPRTALLALGHLAHKKQPPPLGPP